MKPYRADPPVLPLPLRCAPPAGWWRRYVVAMLRRARARMLWRDWHRHLAFRCRDITVHGRLGCCCPVRPLIGPGRSLPRPESFICKYGEAGW